MSVEVVKRFKGNIEPGDHPYLQGPWSPQHDEVNADDLVVLEGQVPTDIDGVYLRNTQNPLHQALGRYHPFDGDGMIHMAAFRDGKVQYRNRFVKTKGLAAEIEAGERLWAGLMEDPALSKRPGWGAHGALKDASSTDVVVHAGKALTTYYQCGEGYRMDPLTLDEAGIPDWSPEDGISAHTKVDEHTGELLFFNYSKKPPFMHYGVVDRNDRLVHYVPVPLPGPRLPHDMAFTQNYAILNDFPLYWDPEALKRDKHVVRFYKDQPSRFAIIPRRGQPEDIMWFEAAPTFVLHWLNAYEEGDEIVLDGYFQEDPMPTNYEGAKPGYERMMSYLDQHKMGTKLHRWRFNLKTGETTEQRLDDRIMEFGMFNQKYAGLPYRFAYSALQVPGWFIFNGYVKTDLQTGESWQITLPEGQFASEAPFAPRVNAKDEDDGYLVTFIINEKTGKSEVALIDCKRFAEGPVCRVQLPHQMASGTHSCWANGADFRDGGVLARAAMGGAEAMGLDHIPADQDWFVPNASMAGPFAPTHSEVVAQDLQVIGDLPADLNGMYVRNGPSPAHAPHGKYHWFDGDGMLHSVRFQGGRATYRNRWVQTDGLKAETEAGQSLWPGLKERMPEGALPDDAMKNTSNTDVKFHNGTLYSMWYRGGAVYTVDPGSLTTLGKLETDPRLVGLQISAHSRVDEATGEFVFFAYGNRHPYMHHGVIGADGALKSLVPVELPGPRLPHDMAITRNYSVLHDFPLINNPEALARGRYSLEFRQDWPTRFAVIPRHGTADQIRWFEFQPRYMLHVANAWEEVNAQGETEIVMLGTPYANPRGYDGGLDVQRLLFTIGTQGTDYELYQWRMNLTTGATREGIVDDILNTEFPMINTRYQGVKNRYTYNVLMGRPRTLEQPHFAGLVKYDLQTGAALAYHPGEGYWFSEAPFAPRDGATEEDDGYVVGFVWNGLANRSEVWVTDARDIAKGPVARVILPQRVPHGFHSCWVRDDQLSAARVA